MKNKICIYYNLSSNSITNDSLSKTNAINITEKSCPEYWKQWSWICNTVLLKIHKNKMPYFRNHKPRLNFKWLLTCGQQLGFILSMATTNLDPVNLGTDVTVIGNWDSAMLVYVTKVQWTSNFPPEHRLHINSGHQCTFVSSKLLTSLCTLCCHCHTKMLSSSTRVSLLLLFNDTLRYKPENRVCFTSMTEFHWF